MKLEVLTFNHYPPINGYYPFWYGYQRPFEYEVTDENLLKLFVCTGLIIWRSVDGQQQPNDAFIEALEKKLREEYHIGDIVTVESVRLIY